MSAEILAANVKRLRLGKGWSQKELAEKAGISLYAVRKFENGAGIDHPIKFGQVVLLARLFDMPTCDFFTKIRPLKHVHFTYHEGDK